MKRCSLNYYTILSEVGKEWKRREEEMEVREGNIKEKEK